MDVEEKEAPLKRAASEGSELGHMIEGVSMQVAAGESGNNGGAEDKSTTEKAQAASVGEKRPPPKAGLFDPPVAGSKRQKQSRYVVVDGHAVLRDNNYGITQGYISVFEGGEFQTVVAAAGGEGAAEDSQDFYINAAGEVSLMTVWRCTAQPFLSTFLHEFTPLPSFPLSTTLTGGECRD